jgi:hypothetical protein
MEKEGPPNKKRKRGSNSLGFRRFQNGERKDEDTTILEKDQESDLSVFFIFIIN